MKEKSVQPKTNLFLIWFHKINRLLNNQLFLSAVIKNQSRTNLNEIRDRKINTKSFILVHSLPRATSSIKNQSRTYLNEIRDRKINTKSFILVHSLPRATSSPQKPLRIPLSNQTHWLHNTYQSGDLEPFKNTHHLCQTTPQITEQPQDLHNNSSYKNTIVKREKEW